MRLLHLSIVCLLALLIFVSSIKTDDSEGVHKQDGQAKGGLKLPEIFNFQNYKRIFHKHYSGFLEELVRQKILLGRVFQSFISLFKYKHGKTSHFLRINHMSDDTPEERKRRHMKLKVTNFIYDPEKQVNEVLMTSESELIGEFSRIEEHKDEEGYKELARELEGLNNGAVLERKRRSLIRPSHNSIYESISELIKPRVPSISDTAELKKKLTHRVPSNNPLHTIPELASSSSGTTNKKGGTKELETLSKLKGRKKLDEVVDDAVDASGEGEEEKKELADEVLIDHRKKNCFLPPKDQGFCGSCYAFTVISLYEYLFCLETGQLVPFSEQFMVDCGARKGLDGCDGAYINPSMEFAEEFGMELAVDYPYMGKSNTCPYDAETSAEEMGAIKVDNPDAKIYKRDQLEYFLEQTPVAIAISLSPEFDEYGGGVDQGLRCLEDEEVHAMLIVGSGRENGQEYYLLRNSFGDSWGERGYYKLAKSALDKCAYQNFIYLTEASFKRYSKMTRRQSAQIFNRGPIEKRTSTSKRNKA